MRKEKMSGFARERKRGTAMGEVIQFPEETGTTHSRYFEAGTEPAKIIILPVVRIERGPDGSEGQTHSGHSTGRRRRRRLAR